MEKFRLRFLIFVLPLLYLGSCVNVNNHKNASGYYGKFICISLNRFLVEINNNITNGKPIADDMNKMFGMSWLEGYVVDKENNDLIIVGRCLDSKPEYHAEDIIVNLQNVLDSIDAPFCSLDPNSTDILRFEKMINEINLDEFEKNIEAYKNAVGGQKVVVGGVPLNSRHAAIMIYADYDMKKISQGLLKVKGIRSGLDISEETSSDKRSNSTSMSRYWLHIKENTITKSYPTFNYNDGIVFINECPVVVLTEKQMIDAEGNLKDNKNVNDKNAQLFAEDMSNNYDTLAMQNKWFAELENIFRLQACFRALAFQDEINKSGIDISPVQKISLKSGNELPESLPGLMNYRIVEKEKQLSDGVETMSHFYFVAGGVSQELKIKNGNMTLTKSIEKMNGMVVQSRPDKEAVKWELIAENTEKPAPEKSKFLKFFEVKK
jgi:hypothetical protein